MYSPPRTLRGKRRLATIARCAIGLIRGPRPRTFPTLSAENLPPMQGRVEIIRDARGIPHIYAEKEVDLYAALGFLQAADRFTQLDILRHFGAGRLTELIGNPRMPDRSSFFPGRRLGDLDAFVRPLNFEATSERDYETACARVRACLEAFAAGVNAALEAMNGVYPIDHVLFGAVYPWRPWDCLITARACALTVALAPLDVELAFDAVRAQLGDEAARDFFPEAPWSEAPVLHAGPVPEPELPIDTVSWGSNNWAVSAERSASGAPLFANDPHVPFIPLPTFWYHAHLECARYRVQGGVLPGCPAFLYGHNGSLAWGVTTAYRDAWDLFRVHRLPHDRTLYRTPRGVGRIEQHSERHTVRFGQDFVLAWESCEHGILYPGWKHHDGVDLALRYVGSDAGAFMEGALKLAEARSVEEHRVALEQMHLGPFDFNHVYAHRDGTIAWEPYGQLVRRKSSGLFVRDAHDPQAQWEGFLPFSESPKIRNPERGVIATANSFTDPEQNHRISSRTHVEPSYRQQRIERVLLANDRHNVASFMGLQSDVQSDYGLAVRDAICRVLAPRYEQQAGVRGSAFRALRSWNGNFDTTEVGPTILAFLVRDLTEVVLVRLLGEEVGKRYLRTRRGIPRMHRLLVDEQDPLRPRVESALGSSWEAILVSSFERTVQRLSAQCGPDPVSWTWGRVHRIRLGLWLAELPLVGRLFRVLDDSFPGDLYTVSPSVALVTKSGLRAFVGATSRFICDLSRPDEAYFAHTSGPSADPTTTYHGGLTRPWRNFEYFRSGLWQPHEIPDPAEKITIVPAPTGEP